MAAGRFRAGPLLPVGRALHRYPSAPAASEDVLLLAQTFLEQAEAEVGRTGLTLSDEAMAALQACPWPGNVRQLRNVVLRAAATAPGRELRAVDLPAEIRAAAVPRPGAPAPPAPAPRLPRRRPLTAAGAEERQALLSHLEASGWNLAAAAKALSISRMTLYRRLERLAIDRP